MSESSDTISSVLIEQDGGVSMNEMYSLGSIISSCVLLILFIIMVAVLANKSYCR
jgi:hypothetical protein